ncbi:MAG TPA: translation elongation factor Ts [Planctomycetaceae bacterium]|nr:translation elongation factor Ts [Planctomycetaceae bacterium]
MADITAEAVRILRERTDLPMMDCKRALVEAQGDQEKAVQILKERVKGLKLKVADRMTSEGKVATLTAADGMSAVMIELQCESAPVAKNDDFLSFCDQLTKQLLNGPGAAGPDELLAQKCPDKPEVTLRDLHDEILNKIRENIVVGRIIKVKGPVAGYTHHDGTLGVLFQAAGQNATAPVLRDVAMHIASMNPTVCLPEQLDPALVAAEKARETEEARKSGKPDNIIEKIVEGKMRTFYDREGVLVAQPFVKDDKKTVAQALSAAGLTATGFIRWRLGKP